MDNQPNSKHDFRLLMIIVFIVFAGFLVLLLASRNKNQPNFISLNQTKVVISPTSLFGPTSGTVTLKIVGSNRHPLTDYLILDVISDSQSIDVVGYDLLLNFNNQAFELISAESTDPDFTIYKYQSDDKLSITGAKKIDSTGSNLWQADKILKLTFKPLKTGRFDFALVNQIGKEKTQLVDNQSKVFFPQTNQVMVEIY